MAQRRAKGEGTLRHRPWDGRYEWRSAPGMRKKTITRKTKAATMKAVAEWLEQERGFKPSRDVTFGEYADVWLAAEEVRVAPATYFARENVIRIHAKPILSPLRMSEIGKRDLERILWPLGDRTSFRYGDDGEIIAFGRAMREKIRSVLHKLFDSAVRENVIQANPVKMLDPEREVAAKEVRALNQRQIAAFFREARGDDYEALFRLALATGARPGELTALRWNDVDFDLNIVSVRASIGLISTTSKERARKRAKAASERAIGVDDTALELLKAAWVSQGRPTTGLMFTVTSRMDGKQVPFDLANIRRRLRSIAERAGIDKITTYTFRHTFATHMIDRGVDMLTVAYLMGHKNTRLLERTYAHVLDTMKKRGAVVSGEILRDAVNGVTARFETEESMSIFASLKSLDKWNRART